MIAQPLPRIIASHKLYHMHLTFVVRILCPSRIISGWSHNITPPHPSRGHPDFPWGKYPAFSQTELEVGGSFRQFLNYLVVSRVADIFLLGGWASEVSDSFSASGHRLLFPVSIRIDLCTHSTIYRILHWPVDLAPSELKR